MAKGVKTGGRVKGTPNKVTCDIKALAQSHGASAIATLASIIMDKEAPPAARVAAIKEMFDRGFGKAIQAVEMTGANGGPIKSESTVTLTAEEAYRRMLDVAS